MDQEAYCQDSFKGESENKYPFEESKIYSLLKKQSNDDDYFNFQQRSFQNELNCLASSNFLVRKRKSSDFTECTEEY